MEIRPATIDDAGALAELSGQLGYPTSEQDSGSRLIAILGSGDHSVLVACDSGGMVMGWIHIYRVLRVESDPFAELGGFVVSETHRRVGIGRRLLDAAEGWGRQQGMKKLRVRSRIERDDARAFYETLGFSTTKQQQVFDKSLIDQP